MKKKLFLCFFARIGWFLIRKCCSLHIGDGQEIGKITLFTKETSQTAQSKIQKCSITGCS